MKRLLKISLDTLIFSLISILIWFILSINVNKDLINIFTLTFPISYISSILHSIFATGVNISKEKGNANDTMSGIFFGTIFTLIIMMIIILKLDIYLNFMNYTVDKIFVIYSVIQIFLYNILRLILTKLYYEEKTI